MPLHCEKWLLELACDLLKKNHINDLKLLNLFCGMNVLGTRVDINPEVKPDILHDAHRISKIIKKKFDVILADPPYSNDESRQLYGTGKINYLEWTKECTKLIKDNGLLIVYHKYIMPNPDPEKYMVIKRVFIGNRSYHLPRVAIYFKRRK